MSVINYQFKMYMEGILCPFESARIKCSPNGVEMNIEVHPTDKLFDLAPKTHIAIFFLDILGDGSWRLLGEGYFSGFAKYDDAAGARTVSLVCRDFRMDIRKTPAAFVFQPDDTAFDKLYLMNRYGLKRTYQTPLSGTTNITSRTHGGLLRPFSALIRSMSKEAGGSVGNNGRFLLDALTRVIWVEAVAASTYGSFINNRIRADKRIIIPENRAGYRFFSEDYLRDFGQQVLFDNSMFGSVESVIMRMGAIFQTFPSSCSTPNAIHLTGSGSMVMADEIYEKIVKDPNAKFGEPYAINSCMLLPPMQFTSPPNCNMIFPCMYERLQWQHDYDNDVTRAYFRIEEIFGGNTELGYATKEVPTSLMAYNKKGGDTPPLTIEERLKGSNIMEGTVNSVTASLSITDSWAVDVMNNPDAYISKVNEKLGKDASSIVNLLKKINRGNETAQAEAENIVKQLNANKVERINKPTVSNVLDRHATMKFLMARFSARTINVSGQLNPYIVCGFPASVIADENDRDKYKTMRSIVGYVLSVEHMIHSSGQASTSILMNCCRFISEPTDIDEWGNPLFCNDTDQSKALIGDDFSYLNKGYDVDGGYPIKKMNPTKTDPNNIMDWEDKNKITEYDNDRRWAKDVLTHRKSQQDNANFSDESYLPTNVGKFYEQIFGQKKENHFMIGHYVDSLKIPKKFKYDTMHEAIDNLSRTQMMNDYLKAMKFAHREVIKEDDYFVKILGASYKISIGDDTFFTNKYEHISKRADKSWYGVPSNANYSAILLKSDYYNKYPNGEFGSIYEKAPATPFLKERINPVKLYIAEVNQRVNSTR